MLAAAFIKWKTIKMKNTIIAIAGGSGSGKTTFAKRLYALLGAEQALILAQDHYYIDQSTKFDKDGGAVNFDHPDAIDFSLMAEHLYQLKNDREIEVPIYDFATHTRQVETVSYQAKPFILVEGILILTQSILRDHFDETVFIEVGEEQRFSRRLERDIRERGRTEQGVRDQFFGQVKPMHDEFVAPCGAYAKHIIGNGGEFDQLIYHFSRL